MRTDREGNSGEALDHLIQSLRATFAPWARADGWKLHEMVLRERDERRVGKENNSYAV